MLQDLMGTGGQELNVAVGPVYHHIVVLDVTHARPHTVVLPALVVGYVRIAQ